MNSDLLKNLLDLKRPLAEISEAKFREVVRLLEEVQHEPDVRQVMDEVRFRLKRVRPTRRPTLQRIFYRPAEDMLVSDPQASGNGLILRRVMSYAWGYYVKTVDRAEHVSLESKLRAVAADDEESQTEIGKLLWASAADVLGTAVTRAQLDKGVRKALIGDEPEAMSDIERLVQVFKVAGSIEELKDLLPPKPFTSLNDEDWSILRRVLGERANPSVDNACGVLLAVMVRASVAAAFLESLAQANIGLSSADRVEVVARLSRLVLKEMDESAKTLAQTGRQDLVARADNARSLVTALVAADKALQGSDPTVRKQLVQLRATAEKVVSEVVTDARAKVTTAIKGGPDAPLDEQLDTERSVLALRKVERFADNIGLDKAVTATLTALTQQVKTEADRLFLSLSDEAKLGFEQQDEAEQKMYWAVRMMELVGNSDEADKLRREGVKLLHG